MKVLVCGDRRWRNAAAIQRELSALLPIDLVIHGGARGADTFGGIIARQLKIPVQVFPALWDKYGKRAGMLRNQQMLDEGKPDYVLAFHEDLAKSKGTADMVRRAINAGIDTVVIKE